MNIANPQSEAFFEARYRGSSDPWAFASSSYELNRYRATLNALSRLSYRRAFEPGCSVGVLTAALAQRADQVIACDISATAVASAKERCREFRNVEIYHRDVAAGPPAVDFDLMVFSELGYYFSVVQLKKIVRRLTGRLEPGAEFVAVHWLGVSPDHVLPGDLVHEVLSDSFPGERLVSSRHAGFRIDTWRKRS
jgi:SAM-dependent methyltransferase